MDKQILPGLKITFLVHAIVALVFGLIYLLIPELFFNLVGWPGKDPVFTRTVGAMLLAFGASSWWCYREHLWQQVKIVVETEAVLTLLGLLVMLWGILFGGSPPIAWLMVVLWAVFAVAFDYFLYRETTVVLKPQT